MRTYLSRRAPLSAVLLFGTVAALPAQDFPVGVTDLSFSNPTGSGSASIACRVHYPADSAGRDVPVRARAGGWPAAVFLHGFAALGSFYGSLGDRLAAAGYVAVMGNTAQFDAAGLARDGAALYPALLAANGAASGPFAGALDPARIALLGHSMGGGAVGNVLAANPGYACGMGLAPVTPASGNAARIDVPFGIVVGAGDSTTPWRSYAEPFYDGLGDAPELKFLHLLDGSATHTNSVGLFLFSATDRAVFDRSFALARGFLDRFLGADPMALEPVIGSSARQAPFFQELRYDLRLPQVFAATALRVGTTSRLSVAARPGRAAILAAARSVDPIPTPIGILLLEPATMFLAFDGVASSEQRFDADLAVPADPSLVGVSLPLQALGATAAEPVRLGNRVTLEIR